MIKFIQNIGDYFTSNYFDEDFSKKVIQKSNYKEEDIKGFQQRIIKLKQHYFKYKERILHGKLRVKDKITETHRLHSQVLTALGYDGDKVQYDELFPIDEPNVLPVRHILYRENRPYLMVMEMQPQLAEGDEVPDGLFEQKYNVEDEELQSPPQKYHRSQWSNVFQVPEGQHISPMEINKAISELFLLEKHQRPKYIVLCAGNKYYLLEQEKWFKGSYLIFDIEDLFSEGTVYKNYYAVFYFLLGKEMLAPEAELILMDQLQEDAHKGAYQVTRDLKEAVIHAVEAIANEAVTYIKNNQPVGDAQKQLTIEAIDAETLKNECLTYVYRLLFVFYAESREDIDILPAKDDVYKKGYSLEILRDLEQVPLNSASSQNGYFFHKSITTLFHLIGRGYNEHNGQNETFRIRHLDSPLFDDAKMEMLPLIKIRNIVWQDIICQLSLSKKVKGKSRGRISYANLGINQLGRVYESLLAFRGFFTEKDYIEVHRKRKSNESSAQVARNDGSFLVPRHRIDDFDPNEIYAEPNDDTRIIPQNTFVYRLSGRDRQKSASYYTPESLTQTTVKYTLKPILEKVEAGQMRAIELLELRILEPAMGAAAFHNEVIDQLADAYLNYRQKELKRKISPGDFQQERQMVKAYIALNNVYGVDINPTAIELGKLSLWLNVMHKDMQTPFFGYRLGIGNAVVGSWFKVFAQTEFIAKYPKTGTRKQRNTPMKKEWWNTAPKHLSFNENGKINRTKNEVYHFLLPDKNMVAAADIKLLKEHYPDQVKHIRAWRKKIIEPYTTEETQLLQALSAAIDQLIDEHYQFQKRINKATRLKPNFFGAYDEGEQLQQELKSYDEKAQLAAERNNTNAPYYKLKLIMDYWCSLWFWDVRNAEYLPSRQEWYEDVKNILNIDFDTLLEESSDTTQNDTGDTFPGSVSQGDLFGKEKQLTLKNYKRESGSLQKRVADAMQQKTSSIFENRRSHIVQELAAANRFFHYQLEFIEVFRERNGFDVAVGNPPWLKISFEEKGLMSEKFPELEIRNITAPQVRKKQAEFLLNPEQKETYFVENTQTNATAMFMGAMQNYPMLHGQQTNLYKCVIENGFYWISQKGYLGLLHPDGVYDDPQGQPLRKEIYPRLKYHFQFQNAFNLFLEVAHREKYAVNIYSGKHEAINFYSINNLFHPATVDGCFKEQSTGLPGGIKIKNPQTGQFEWNLKPHRSRKVHFTEKELRVLAKAFEGSEKWQLAKLVSVHAAEIIPVLEKLSYFPGQVKDFETRITVCWDETNDLNAGHIRRETQYPEFDKYQMIYSGPHFYVGNPLYKTPREICKEKADYDTIDLTQTSSEYIARTNYLPSNVDKNYHATFDGITRKTYTWQKTVAEPDDMGREHTQTIEKKHTVADCWFDYYKIAFRKMLGQPNERTLFGAIIPPKTAHIHGVISITMPEVKIIELMGLSLSIILDFFIKTVGVPNLSDSRIKAFPMGIAEKYKPALFVRTLMLNCLNTHYAALWERNWQERFKQDKWSKADKRLKPFHALTGEWKWETPLRNWYERRQALIEIDVITAMALGLSLKELILIYNVQFPVLQQNEDETWYDQFGNVVFTVSKGLAGVGVDRDKWNKIKHLKAGETYEHTIEKSELYYGQKVTYHAPFNKCNRVEDYKVAWGHFEEVF